MIPCYLIGLYHTYTLYIHIMYTHIYTSYHIIPVCTAQGSSGSFKDRKPIGEVPIGEVSKRKFHIVGTLVPKLPSINYDMWSEVFQMPNALRTNIARRQSPNPGPPCTENFATTGTKTETHTFNADHLQIET